MEYRIALITGASVGIGKAVAMALAGQNMQLVLVARRMERLQELAQQIGERRCHLVACDVTDQQAMRAELARLPEEFREIDVLVNNAGMALGLETADKSDWGQWQQMIDTNCTALAWMTRQLLPGMVERNRGHVINLGSIAGTYPYRGGNVYGATKAFVEQFSLNLKADLLGTGVRVTNIEPGLVGGSEFSLVRFSGDAERAGAVYQGLDPLLPEDVAEAVAWALRQPAHVNINRIELMPVCQAPARTDYAKRSD